MKPTKQSNFAEKLRQKGCGDLLFLGGVLILAAYGVLCVYSASSYNAEVQYGDAYYFLKKQIIGFVIGFAAMIGIGFLPYRKLNRRWVGLTALAVSLILLALVFVPGLGKSNYGATRWIGFGSFTIQPSEIAKYGFVLFT